MTTSSPLAARPVALVVGASGGLGQALARELAAQGWRVALLARRQAVLEGLAHDLNARHGPDTARAYPRDVTDYDAVDPTFRRILQDMGRLDAVLYGAGVLHPTAEAEFDFAKDRVMLEVNLTAAVAWLDQAATLFRMLGRGHIVGISSVAGDRGRVGMPAYHAAKAGLTTYLESLRNRLTRHGVHVLTVKPGFIDTPMLQTARPKKVFWVASPEQVARDVVRAMRRRKQVIYTPARWRWVMLVIQHIPSFVFRRLAL